MTPIIKKSGRTVFGVRIGLKKGFSSNEGFIGMKGRFPLPSFQSLLPEGGI